MSAKKGDSVNLTANSLKKAGTNDGTFSVTVTVKDTDSETASITFTGKVMDAPEIKTSQLAKATANSEKEYNSKLELSAGSEPLYWTINGTLPDGLTHAEDTDNKGRKYYLISGYTEAPGTYPIELKVSNDVGTASKKFTLDVAAVKPKIKTPAGFEKTYSVKENDEFEIDLSGLEITGTKPLSIDVDTASIKAGLSYDSNSKSIKGKIANAPSKGTFNVNLEVRNPYTQSSAGGKKPVTLTLKINVLTPPDDIQVKYSNFDVFNEKHNEWGDLLEGYVSMKKNFKMSFTAGKGSKPVTWHFIYPDVPANGAHDILNDRGGELYGLKFNRNGTISGIPNPPHGFFIWVFADNGAVDRTNGYDTSSFYTEIYIELGLPPEFDKDAISEVITLTNGASVDINLNGFLTAETVSYGFEFAAAGKLPSGLKLNDNHITGTLNIKNKSEIKKYKIDLTAKNNFGTTKGKITLDIQDPPGGRILAEYTTAAPVKKGQYYLSVGEDGYESPSFCPAVIGKSFKMKFTTETGSNVKWDFLLENMSNDKYNGKYVIKDLGGSLGGLTFKDNGTISGTPTKPDFADIYVMYFRPVASNSVGTQRAKGLIEIAGGVPPAFLKSIMSKPIMLTTDGAIDSSLLNYIWYTYNDEAGYAIHMDNFIDFSGYEYSYGQEGRTDDGGYYVWNDTFTYTGTLPSGLKFYGKYDSLTDDYPHIGGKLKLKNANDCKKYKINLTASNMYGTAKGTITLDVQSAPDGMNVSYTTSAPEKKGSYDLSKNASQIFRAVTEKNFSAKFTAKLGSKPLTWDFLIESSDDYSDGTKIIEGIGGEYLGLTFKNDGTIKGKPSGEGCVTFRAIVSNNAGSQTANTEITISAGEPPVFKESTSTITLSNGSYVYEDLGRLMDNHLFIMNMGKFNYTGTLPSGLKLYNTTFDSGGNVTENARIEGKLNLKNAKDIKKYTINLTASNEYGTAKCKLILDIVNSTDVSSAPIQEVKDAPDNEEPEDLESILSSDIETEDNMHELHVIRERDISDLNAFTLGHVSNDEYVIACVLPELEVKENGMYDFDIVLSDDIEAGKKLFWFAFPKDKESSVDDEIAEFYDESGAEIECVPESHKFTVGVWLNEGVTYDPVIAVRRKE